MKKMSEIGEIEVLKKHVFPKLHLQEINIQNDCVTIDIPKEGKLIWNIDPLPTPMAWMLGIEQPEILGWYTALINLSDIAANGGKPLGITVSVEIPDTEDLDFYLKFNEGLLKACKEFEAPLLGGNLKSSNKFSATGSAIGLVKHNLLSRRGIKPGFRIFVIGRTGFFWAAVLKELSNIKPKSKLNELEMKKDPPKLDKMLYDALCYPSPQLKAGTILSELPFKVACMDSSDGLLNCFYQFSDINNVDIYIQDYFWDNKLPNDILEIYKKNGINPNNACFSWGEWQLVCAIEDEKENIEEMQDRLFGKNIPCYEVGYALKDTENENGNVYSINTKKKVNKCLLNERFISNYNSWSPQKIMEFFLTQEMFT